MTLKEMMEGTLKIIARNSESIARDPATAEYLSVLLSKIVYFPSYDIPLDVMYLLRGYAALMIPATQKPLDDPAAITQRECTQVLKSFMAGAWAMQKYLIEEKAPDVS